MIGTPQTRARADAGRLWAGLSVVLAASVLLPLPGAGGRIAHLPAICPFYTLTGLPCPGCGLTRAFVCLGHGHWHEAWHWHPLGWLLYGVLILLWLRSGLFWGRGVTLLPLSSAVTGRLGWGAAVVLLVFGAGRIAWLTSHHLRF